MDLDESSDYAIDDLLTRDADYDNDSFFSLENGISVKKENGVYYIDDMLFNDSTLFLLSQIGNSRSATLSNASLYWRGRTVYYSFFPSSSALLQLNACQAMAELESSSGLVFLPASNSFVNQIVFKDTLVNNSYVGMIGGQQRINIASSWNPYVIMHEIMHALGFFHEHQRSDRDNYISINWNNIRPSHYHDFDVINSSTGINVGDFNFDSIMMYGSYTSDTSFVYDTNEYMMTKLDNSIINPNSDYLSQGDIESIQSVYGPPYHRLEERITVYEDEVTGNEEIYDAYHETWVKFYQDTDCTIRQGLSFPRVIAIRHNEQQIIPGLPTVYDSGAEYIVVPVGVDSVFIDARRNTEHYLNSDPEYVDIKYYAIDNSHVPNSFVIN